MSSTHSQSVIHVYSLLASIWWQRELGWSVVNYEAVDEVYGVGKKTVHVHTYIVHYIYLHCTRPNSGYIIQCNRGSTISQTAVPDGSLQSLDWWTGLVDSLKLFLNRYQA